jgi:biotin carboxylase
MRYRKQITNGISLYRYAETVDLENELSRLLIDYVLKVLDAVGVHNGFTHTELFMTDKGPRLVEVNPRIAGASGFHNLQEKISWGDDQVDLFALSIFDEESFSMRCAVSPQFRKKCRVIFLQKMNHSPVGKINLDLFQEIPSFSNKYIMRKEEGTVIEEIKYMFDTVAYVILENSDIDKLDEDTNRLFELESKDLLF